MRKENTALTVVRELLLSLKPDFKPVSLFRVFGFIYLFSRPLFSHWSLYFCILFIIIQECGTKETGVGMHLQTARVRSYPIQFSGGLSSVIITDIIYVFSRCLRSQGLHIYYGYMLILLALVQALICSRDQPAGRCKVFVVLH